MCCSQNNPSCTLGFQGCPWPGLPDCQSKPCQITGTAVGIRNHGTENLERLIERYADASEEESLIDADEVRNSFIQFKQFLKSNEDNPLKELREILAKPGVYEDIFPSFVTLTQVFQTIPLTSVPCERYFSAQNRIHGALRNKMSPSAVECKMHISYAYKRHVTLSKKWIFFLWQWWEVVSVNFKNKMINVKESNLSSRQGTSKKL